MVFILSMCGFTYLFSLLQKQGSLIINTIYIHN